MALEKDWDQFTFQDIQERPSLFDRFGVRFIYTYSSLNSVCTMFPTHLSVNDLGVFAVAMVFGLIVVLLFMFDFVSRH